MKKKEISAFLFAVSVGIPLIGCDLSKHETAKTKEQLSQLAQDVGLDENAAHLTEYYQKNISPSIIGAAQSVRDTAAAETAAGVTQGAADSLKEMSQPIIEKTTVIYETLPKSEGEVESLIAQYNEEFTDWLRNQFRSAPSFNGIDAFGSLHSTKRGSSGQGHAELRHRLIDSHKLSR